MTGRHSLAFGLIHALLTIEMVRGQTTNTTCQQNSTTSFLFNDQNESPCMTWAKLQSLCVPPSAVINVPPLVDRTYGYNSPGNQGTACQCNLVAYNLMAGCSWCQIGSGGSWSSQWAYEQGCQNFKVDNLGFSQASVDIPSYAWRNWDTDRFDPALAAAAAPSFATTSLAPQSATLSRNFATSTPASASATRPSSSGTISAPQPNAGTGNDAASDADAEPKDSGPSMGVMIGAIAGSVGVVVIFALMIFFLVLRRRRKRSQIAPIITLGGLDEKDKRGSRRFDPNYHSSKDWKSKHRSILEILTPKGGDANSAHGVANRGDSRKGPKPFSQLFTSPRTAPLPFGHAPMTSKSNQSLESLRYTTTSQRLGHKGGESFSSGSEVSFGLSPPQVVGYTKAKNAPSFPQPAVTESVFSQITAGTPGYGAAPPQSALLQAVNQMRRDEDEDEDDPLITPPRKDYDKHSSYPFPHTPPTDLISGAAVGAATPLHPPSSPAGGRQKALPSPPSRIKTRLSTKIPDPRFSAATTAITLPQPPITPAHDFTLAPDEYRRKQSHHLAGPPPDSNDIDAGARTRAKSVLPSLYEPSSAATRFSLGQRTDTGRSRPVTQYIAPDAMPVPLVTNQGPTPEKGGLRVVNDKSETENVLEDGESIIFSATPSISASTDSRYSSFIPDAQTVARVKAAFVSSLNSPSPKETGSPPLRFPLPPSRSGSKGPEHEWERAKSKQKLSQEVKKIGKGKGKTGPVQERGDENGLRRKGV